MQEYTHKDTHMPKIPAFFKNLLRRLGPVVVTCIFSGAVWLLYNQLRKYSMADIADSIERISVWHIVASLVLMVVNYAILVGYDWLALKGIHKTLSLPRVTLVSFVGQAVSYNFGALLGGTTVRYRFYTAWGFSPMDIVRLVLMLAVTFWVGALGLVGAIFIIAPPDIPAELGLHLAMGVRPLGFILLSIAMSYLVVCYFVHKPIHIFGKEFSFPPFKIAVAQALTAGADLIVAGACLYVLLPPDADVSFIQFLPSYLMGMVMVVLSHVPGGVGVLEVVILHLTTADPQGVFAALILFRAIYYLIPLLAAAVLFAVYEIRHQAAQSEGVLHDAGRWMRAFAPTMIAMGVFCCGALILFSSVLPMSDARIALLQEFEPLAVMEIGQLAAALCGVLLVFLAPGIQHRKAAALRLTLAALTIALFGMVFGALSWTSAIGIVVTAGCVWSIRARCCRPSSLWFLRLSPRWALPALGVVVVAAGLGMAIHHSDPSDSNVWLAAAYAADAPRLLRTLGGEALLLFYMGVGYLRTAPLRRFKRLAVHNRRQAKTGVAHVCDQK